MFVQSEWPSFVDEDAVYELVGNVLDIAKEGLTSRGYGAEAFLEPLYDRMNHRTNPAKKMLELRAKGTDLQDIILEYGRIE